MSVYVDRASCHCIVVSLYQDQFHSNSLTEYIPIQIIQRTLTSRELWLHRARSEYGGKVTVCPPGQEGHKQGGVYIAVMSGSLSTKLPDHSMLVDHIRTRLGLRPCLQAHATVLRCAWCRPSPWPGSRQD